MNKKVIGIFAGAIVALAVILSLLLPPDDICSDDVRGYERNVSSALSATRKLFNSIKARVNVEENLKVPQQLDGLNPRDFAALKGIDTQCKLLGKCLQFVFFDSPSEACPTEYADYKEMRDSALNLLTQLEELQVAAQSADDEAERLNHARQDVDRFQDSSGSTGGRLATLQARVAQRESNLSHALAGISSHINELVSHGINGAEQ